MNRQKQTALDAYHEQHIYDFKAGDPPDCMDGFEAGWDAASLQFRVDVFYLDGWQYRASFAGQIDAYEYGEKCSLMGARVWEGDVCIATTNSSEKWHAPPHNRDCDGKPCECGAVPPLGSMAKGR